MANSEAPKISIEELLKNPWMYVGVAIGLLGVKSGPTPIYENLHGLQKKKLKPRRIKRPMRSWAKFINHATRNQVSVHKKIEPQFLSEIAEGTIDRISGTKDAMRLNLVLELLHRLEYGTESIADSKNFKGLGFEQKFDGEQIARVFRQIGTLAKKMIDPLDFAYRKKLEEHGYSANWLFSDDLNTISKIKDLLCENEMNPDLFNPIKYATYAIVVKKPGLLESLFHRSHLAGYVSYKPVKTEEYTTYIVEKFVSGKKEGLDTSAAAFFGLVDYAAGQNALISASPDSPMAQFMNLFFVHKNTLDIVPYMISVNPKDKRDLVLRASILRRR